MTLNARVLARLQAQAAQVQQAQAAFQQSVEIAVESLGLDPSGGRYQLNLQTGEVVDTKPETKPTPLPRLGGHAKKEAEKPVA